MRNYPILQYLFIFYSFVFLLDIVNVFLESEKLNYFIGILAIIMLAVSFISASKLFRVLGILFLGVGAAVFIGTGQSFPEIPAMFTSNISLLTLFCMLPWMNSVVKSGRFDRSLNKLLHVKVSNLGQLYPRSSITTLILGAFLNLSAATIAQDVLKTNLKSIGEKVRNSFISTATLRGYTVSLLWSPLEILLATAIFLTGADYVSLLPWLLLISALTFILDSLWGRIFYKKHAYKQEHVKKIDYKEVGKKLVHLLISLALFLTLVIVIGSAFDLDFIFTVTILIFPFAFVWSVIMKRVRSFWTIGWPTWKEKTNTMQNFVVLFISLAFFANSIDGTAVLDFIQKPITAFSDYPLLIFFFIQLIFIGMSLIGVHPLGTIGVLTGVITLLLETINPVSLAIVIVTGAVSTLTVGAYGLVVQITSMNTGQNPYRITWTNMPFALIYGGIGSIVAYLLL